MMVMTGNLEFEGQQQEGLVPQIIDPKEGNLIVRVGPKMKISGVSGDHVRTLAREGDLR
jgi:hypothetical protein